MSLVFSLRKLLGLPRGTAARARGNNFRRRPRRPLLELLEDRLAPATIAYQVPAGTAGTRRSAARWGWTSTSTSPSPSPGWASSTAAPKGCRPR